MSKTSLINTTSFDLTLAAWLSHDTYDYESSNEPDDDLPIISATQLLKPTRALILAQRIPPGKEETPLVDQTKRMIGQSIHEGIERAIKDKSMKARLAALGFSEQILKNLTINPSAVEKDEIPIYLERRAYRKIKTSAGTEIWISGKFDQVIGGCPEDNKTTGVYSYINMDQTNQGEYSQQMSIYKWISPHIITSDTGRINFIFTDWKAGEVKRVKNYPPYPAMEMPVPLMSIQHTEQFIRAKLDEIEQNASIENQDEMIECTDEQLWRSPDIHKYYADPEKAKIGGRSTKNFDELSSAMAYKTQQGKGVVLTVPGEVKRCNYCEAAPACTQRLQYQSE